MLHLKKIEEITQTDLQALVTEGVKEGQRIDFKRAINLAAKEAQAELFRDISSFANASGGDLVIGVEEKESVATNVAGIEPPNMDEFPRRIRDLCRAHIDPPITTIQFNDVTLPTGKMAIVIRILKTWNGPHMVTMDEENSFWVRDHNGKRKMDLPDLKQAMVYSSGVAERMKRFRLERISEILSGEASQPLSSPQCLILHVLPLISFTGGFEVDLDAIDNGTMRPMRSSGWSSRHSLEGKLVYSSLPENKGVHSYSLLFRNGIIEAVESDGLSRRQSNKAGATRLFYLFHGNDLVQALNHSLAVYRKMEMPPPIFASISLTGVKGYTMNLDPSLYSSWNDAPLRRDVLHLPEVLIDDFDKPAAELLRPSFDVWWQACGFPKCSWKFDKQ